MEKRTGAAKRTRQAHKPPQKHSGTRILTVFAVILAVMIAGVGCGLNAIGTLTKINLI